MRLNLTTILSAVALTAMLALAPNAASAAAAAGNVKTAKACDAEYSANKAAIQGAGQKKADFVAACRAGTEVIPGATTAATPAATTTAPAPAPAAVKTAKACDDEYSANKDAIKAGGQSKKDFVAACRAGTEVIPTAAASTPTPTPAATAPTAPVSNPKPPKTTTATVAPTATTTPTGANEFATEAQAKARCPAGPVVWVNLKSQIWHWAGTHDYGTTKEGAYMCETDATAEGARAAKNEKQPS